MFGAKFGRTDSHTFAAAASVANTSGTARSAPSEQMIGIDDNRCAVFSTTVETATATTLITACLFCRYRKPAGRPGENANA